MFKNDLIRVNKEIDFMASRKPSGRKNRLMKKMKQNSSVPAWVIVRTNRKVRRNPKQRQWRRSDVEVG